MANPHGTPANLRPKPFPKGVSGNPGGRPKGVCYPSEWLRKWAAMTYEQLEAVPVSQRTTTWENAYTLATNARAGEYQHLNKYIEMLEGKITERQEVNLTVRSWSELARNADDNPGD